MTVRSFATSLSPFETNADYIFFFMLLLSDEINLPCVGRVTEWIKASFKRRPQSNDLGLTPTAITLLRL